MVGMVPLYHSALIVFMYRVWDSQLHLHSLERFEIGL